MAKINNILRTTVIVALAVLLASKALRAQDVVFFAEISGADGGLGLVEHGGIVRQRGLFFNRPQREVGHHVHRGTSRYWATRRQSLVPWTAPDSDLSDAVQCGIRD